MDTKPSQKSVLWLPEVTHNEKYVHLTKKTSGWRWAVSNAGQKGWFRSMRWFSSGCDPIDALIFLWWAQKNGHLRMAFRLAWPSHVLERHMTFFSLNRRIFRCVSLKLLFFTLFRVLKHFHNILSNTIYYYNKIDGSN